MNKVLLHNLTIPYKGAHPDTYYFDHNAFFFAEEDDVVVVRAGVPELEPFLQYFKAEGIMTDFSQLEFSKRFSAYDSVFLDEELVERLRRKWGGQDLALDVFMPTGREYDFAARTGLLLAGFRGQYESNAAKSRFRRIAKLEQIPVTPGFGGLSSQTALAVRSALLFLGGAREVVIKDDSGVAGRSTKRLWRSEAFNFRSLIPSQDIEGTTERTFVVERWENDVSQRPSVQGYIDEAGQGRVLSIHDQLMRSDGITYSGCRSEHSFNGQTIATLKEHALKLMRVLAANKYQGHVALGALLTHDGRILHTEMNPRRVMSSYAHRIAERMAGSRNLKPYIVEEITNPEWRGLTPFGLLKRLDRALFRKNQSKGVVPFNIQYLGFQGSAMIFSSGDTFEEAQYYLDHAKHC